MTGFYWLASYPKSGNTWLRVFLRNYRDDGESPVNINALRDQTIASARGWLDDVLGFDTAHLTHDEVDQLRPAVYQWTAAHEPEAYHKIHDAFRILPSGTPLIGQGTTRGVVYVVRNPLDVAPSFAHHMSVDIDTAITRMADPGFGLSDGKTRSHLQVRQVLSTWSDHVRGWRDAPDLNRLIIRYEDMHARPLATFGAVVRFLDLPHDTERLKKALRFSAFDEVSRQEGAEGFKERPPGVTHFFRGGRVGDWSTVLSDAQVARLIADHGAVMRELGYLDEQGRPVRSR